MSEALRKVAIRLNDAKWPSESARADGLRELAFLLPGSSGLDDVAFALRLAEATIREIVPLALRGAAEKNPAHATALCAAADRCAAEGTREAAYAAANAAYAAYAAANAANAASNAADVADDNRVLTAMVAIACRIVRQLQAEARGYCNSYDLTGDDSETLVRH